MNLFFNNKILLVTCAVAMFFTVQNAAAQASKNKTAAQASTKHLSEAEWETIASAAWDTDDKAMEKIIKAAEQGDPIAQSHASDFYLLGVGVEFDHAKGIEYLKKSAEAGYAGSQYGLGLKYYEAEGVGLNHKEAYRLFSLAAEQGKNMAYFRLSNMYAEGVFVKKDIDKAIELMEKSIAIHDFSLSKRKLKELKAIKKKQEKASSACAKAI